MVMAQEWKDEVGNRCRECVGMMYVKGQGMELSEQ
jgi:hypothetical protein